MSEFAEHIKHTNAVLVAAGRKSLHRQFLKGKPDFDLHLLVYDDSASQWQKDTPFVYNGGGYKMDMTFKYLQLHPELLEAYNYFFLMDDDVRMSTEEVNHLFECMLKFHLEIAQPALVDSFYTYEHTLYHQDNHLRYTNFIEMMIPCFSRNALKKVLPTFKKKKRAQGIEWHWPQLIQSNQKDMAVIDEVTAVHTRPVHYWDDACKKALQAYHRQFHLTTEIIIYGSVPL